jgi:HD-GYP domain-containing protein (c-di-GMP phosphodiesterase class II)
MPAAARQVSSFEESFFCQRLQSLADQNKANRQLANLVNATRGLLESAAAISKQIVRFLPQFTSHDEIHLWNVLGFMEHLAGGKAGIDQLSAGDCAMAVWAAFIHDLGMVLEAGELAAIDRIDEFDVEPNEQQPPSDERVLAWRDYR